MHKWRVPEGRLPASSCTCYAAGRNWITPRAFFCSGCRPGARPF